MISTEVFKNFSYGVYIVGSKENDRSVGCIANSIMQVTSQNPTIAISINNDNYTNMCIEKTKMFSISILHEKTNQEIIGTFGFSTSKDNNKWEKFEHLQVENLPVLKDSIGYVICKVVDKMQTKTHTVFLGEVIEADMLLNNQEPMTYAYYHNVIKGKSPKNAPTYIEEKESNDKYVCDICGYVYDGDIPFEDLPDDYICPVCGVGKEHFKLRKDND